MLAHCQLQHGKLCLRSPGSPRIPSSDSEDCLFLDVYAPTNATVGSKLPVFVFIQGGGFNSNANQYINGSGLITASRHNMVFVTFTYRVGPYGFLTDGKKLKANNGLRDQRKVLEWVQKHIAKFGGNPKHVTLGGASAGAASVGLHLTAYGGQDKGLFHAAAAQSVSFGTMLTVNQSLYQYNDLVKRSKCGNKDPIACLRSKSAQALQALSRNIPYPGVPDSPIFMWGPTVDNDLWSELPYDAFRRGRFIKVPVIFGDDTDGGTTFAWATSTRTESNQFLKTQFPYLKNAQLMKINDLYPNKNEKTCPKKGCWKKQTSAAYGEMRYMCPGLFINNEFARHGVKNSYAYRYNVEDPDQIKAGVGVPHIVDITAVFGPTNIPGRAPESYYPGKVNALAVSVMQSYWVSFITTYDPNKGRCCGSVEWKPWVEKDQQRIRFDTGGRTVMEKIDNGLKKRCEYFASIGVSVRQ